MIDRQMSGDSDSAKPVSTPLKLPPSVAERIAEEIGKLVPRGGLHIDDEGIRHKGLPLMGRLGGVWLLRADGSLWTVDSDFGLPVRPLEDRCHTMALVAGTERYPWLKELLPERPATAVECDLCKGAGALGPQHQVLCYKCDALGWRVPKEQT